MRATAATVVVVLALVAVNVAEHRFGVPALWLGPIAAVALVVFAKMIGITWEQMGFGLDRFWPGVRWALGGIGVVALVYVAGVLFPPTRSAFLDSRYHFDLHGALVSAFVVIPLGTVLFEEVAFRSVLWAVLSRQASGFWVLVTSSTLFGLWHLLPALAFGAANQGASAVLNRIGPWGAVLLVVGTVAFTALTGVVAGEMRRRSGSVLASAGTHWATNALGVLFGIAAWHMAS